MRSLELTCHCLAGDEKDIKAVMETVREMLKIKGKNDQPTINMDDNNERPELDEEKLLQTYQKVIGKCNIEIYNFHDTPCACSERLCQRSDLNKISKYINKPAFTNSAWLCLQAYWITKYNVINSDEDLYESIYICR